MKHIATLIDAPDDLSRAGVLGVLDGARYKPTAIKGGWEAVVASGKELPEIVILVLSGALEDGAAVARKIEAIAKVSKVIILADRCETDFVVRVLSAGGSAFLPRSVGGDTLIQTLALVSDGESVVPLQMLKEALVRDQALAEPNRAESEAVTAREHPVRLSLREIDILKRLMHGDSNKQIGRRFDISEMTVKVHMKTILRKVRARNRTQAAVWGLDHLSDALGAEAGIVPDASGPDGSLWVPVKRGSTIPGSSHRLATAHRRRLPQ